MYHRIISRPFSRIMVFLSVFVLKYICGVEVTIGQGTLRGAIYESRNGSRYYGYLGIPYAKPPIAELRFEPPQLPDPWWGLKIATQAPPVCIQMDYFGVHSDPQGQEDCLYLNVFTPSINKDSLPVLVFIHGGAFKVGSTRFINESYFMDHEIVMVFIQYRLNVFGFLSTGDEVLPGNMGMKDQSAALRWVQNNIAAFGGDPTRVMIFGESAGAASVHYHLYSPLSKGLFRRAICQSGTSLAMWAYTPTDVARQRARALGTISSCLSENFRIMVDCLKKIPAEELIKTHAKLYTWSNQPVITMAIVEEPDNLPGAFVTENPWHADPINNVSLIIGINSGEGALTAAAYLQDNGKDAKYLNKHYKRLFPIFFCYNTWIEDKTQISNVTERIKNFYYGHKDIGVETALELSQSSTDGAFAYDSIEAARRYKSDKVYFYFYDHRNKRTFAEFYRPLSQDLGVSHGDDLISFFYLRGKFPIVTQGDDFHVSERLIKYWVNFAYDGVPDKKWTPVISDDVEYLHITTKVDQMKTRPIYERYQFWKSLQLEPSSKTKKSENPGGYTTANLIFLVLLLGGILVSRRKFRYCHALLC